MKLKQRPEDFQVEELSDVHPGTSGVYALYRLDKTGWTTTDALAAVRRRWGIDSQRLSYGGLKDRHAVTSQHFTIYRGPNRNLNHERIVVTHLGQCTEAFSAWGIRANRFTITLRSLSSDGVVQARAALGEVAEAGLPNYFDDQRFGSVGQEREFIAKEMVHGRFERALWLALAAPYEFDRAEEKKVKAILREHWAEWPACKALLPKSHARSLVDYLATHPTDFKGAVARLRPELQGLYLSAYQSDLWNRMLALWLTRNLPSADLAKLETKLAMLPAPIRVSLEWRERWNSLVLPLPSARMKPAPGEEWAALIEEVLREEGLTLPELRIKGLQKPFFSKGDRPACVRPQGLQFSDEADELHAGKRKVLLRFELPRGSYATMLVKRLTT